MDTIFHSGGFIMCKLSNSTLMGTWKEKLVEGKATLIDDETVQTHASLQIFQPLQVIVKFTRKYIHDFLFHRALIFKGL